MNILITTTVDISNPSWGGANRIIELIKGLEKVKKEINLYLLAPKLVPYFKNVITDYYLSHRTYETFGRIHNITILDEINPFRTLKIEEIIKKYNIDITQNEFIWGFHGTYLSKLINNQKNILLIVDEHNFEYQLSQETKRHLFIQQYTLMLENLSLKMSDHILSVSKIDKNNISKRYNIPQDKISVIPNGVDTSKYKPLDSRKRYELKQKLGLEDKTILIFHGKLDHPPNTEAVYYIINYILPNIITEIPDVFCLIVGMNPPRIKYNPQYVRFTGAVKDLQLYISAADIAIIPILSGSGTRLKALEYMACGRPIVATYKAIEGIDVEHKKHMMLSKTVSKKFVDNILLIYNDKKLALKLSRNSRRLAETKYDWYSIAKKLYDVYKRLLFYR